MRGGALVAIAGTAWSLSTLHEQMIIETAQPVDWPRYTAKGNDRYQNRGVKMGFHQGWAGAPISSRRWRNRSDTFYPKHDH